MNKITIVTDSASDLNLDLMEDYNIKFASMTVDINDKVYKDKIDLTNIQFYESIKEKNVFPKTAQIPPYEFEEIFKEELSKGNDIICITVSSSLSGTYNSANIAKSTLESNKIYVIDSQSVSIGQGFLVYEAAKKAREGNSVSEIVQYIESLKSKQDVIIMIDTMEMLKRGGRISSTKAAIGGILGIKPLLTIKDGALDAEGKAKGKKSAIKEMMDYIKTKTYDSNYNMGVAHGNDIDGCNRIVETISIELGISNMMISEIGPSVGAHAGPGALAVFFIKK